MPIKTCCIVLNYNDWKTTCEQLNRLQENEAIDKILVVDNCSTDSSCAEIEKNLTDKMEFLRSTKNGGYGAGNNIGIRRAAELGARFIIIANPDTIFTSECVETIIRSLEQDSKCAAGSALEKFLNGKFALTLAWKSATAKSEILSYGRIGSRRMQNKLFFSPEEITGSLPVPVFAVPGSMFIMDTAKSCLLFDEKQFLYYEEKMLGMKAQKGGYHFCIVPTVSFIHDHHTSIRKSTSYLQREYLWLKSKRYYIRACYVLSPLEMVLDFLLYHIARLEFLFLSKQKTAEKTRL